MVNIRDTQPEPLVVPLSTDGSESLTFDVGGISGWAAYHSGETERRGLMVRLRVTPASADQDAPIEMRELRVAAGEGAIFNSGLLRTIPFPRIIAAINRPTIAEQIRPFLAPYNSITTDAEPGSGQWAYALPPRK